MEAKAELVDYCLHWGLDNPEVLSDLVALSKNLADTREGDSSTYEFVHGRAHKALFSHFSFSLAALATTCVIVELLFSQMKNVQLANETSESVDELLMLIFNVLGTIGSCAVRFSLTRSTAGIGVTSTPRSSSRSCASSPSRCSSVMIRRR